MNEEDYDVRTMMITNELFGRSDRRLAIGLNRVAAIMHGDTVTGLTFRIGRHFEGAASMIYDIMERIADTRSNNQNCNVLLLGPPSMY